MNKRGEVSFLVFAGFVLLFIIFLFFSPNERNSGSAIIGSTTLGESPSIITLIVLFIVLVVALAVVFVVFKKLKSKKVHVESPTKVQENKIAGNAEKKEEHTIEFDNGDIEKLFSENHGVKGESVEKPKEESLEKIQTNEKKVLTNLQELKNKVKMMLSQNFSKEQIISNLKSQGVTIEQINKTFEEVNTDNLRGYINQSLKQGDTKEQIIRNLIIHGWKQEQISKVLNKEETHP